jgi:hypothetical protein
MGSSFPFLFYYSLLLLLLCGLAGTGLVPAFFRPKQIGARAPAGPGVSTLKTRLPNLSFYGLGDDRIFKDKK